MNTIEEMKNQDSIVISGVESEKQDIYIHDGKFKLVLCQESNIVPIVVDQHVGRSMIVVPYPDADFHTISENNPLKTLFREPPTFSKEEPGQFSITHHGKATGECFTHIEYGIDLCTKLIQTSLDSQEVKTKLKIFRDPSVFKTTFQAVIYVLGRTFVKILDINSAAYVMTLMQVLRRMKERTECLWNELYLHNFPNTKKYELKHLLALRRKLSYSQEKLENFEKMSQRMPILKENLPTEEELRILQNLYPTVELLQQRIFILSAEHHAAIQKTDQMVEQDAFYWPVVSNVLKNDFLIAACLSLEQDMLRLNADKDTHSYLKIRYLYRMLDKEFLEIFDMPNFSSYLNNFYYCRLAMLQHYGLVQQFRPFEHTFFEFQTGRALKPCFAAVTDSMDNAVIYNPENKLVVQQQVHASIKFQVQITSIINVLHLICPDLLSHHSDWCNRHGFIPEQVEDYSICLLKIPTISSQDSTSELDSNPVLINKFKMTPHLYESDIDAILVDEHNFMSAIFSDLHPLAQEPYNISDNLLSLDRYVYRLDSVIRLMRFVHRYIPTLRQHLSTHPPISIFRKWIITRIMSEIEYYAGACYPYDLHFISTAIKIFMKMFGDDSFDWKLIYQYIYQLHAHSAAQLYQAIFLEECCKNFITETAAIGKKRQAAELQIQIQQLKKLGINTSDNMQHLLPKSDIKFIPDGELKILIKLKLRKQRITSSFIPMTG
jgi:hypothetical protein